MAAVIDKAHDRYEYYTLEKTVSLSSKMKDPWVIGGVGKDMSHLNSCSEHVTFSFFAYYINRKVLYLQTKWQKKNLWQNVEK